MELENFPKIEFFEKTSNLVSREALCGGVLFISQEDLDDLYDDLEDIFEEAEAAAEAELKRRKKQYWRRAKKWTMKKICDIKREINQKINAIFACIRRNTEPDIEDLMQRINAANEKEILAEWWRRETEGFMGSGRFRPNIKN
jgi:succinylglutamate desuccinylase